MPLGIQAGLSPGDVVFHGDPVPFPKKGAEHPIFGPGLLCPSGCIWIKMPLGTEVGLGLRYIVLDGDPAPLL